MRRSHFEALSPHCPVCATAGRQGALAVTAVLREDGEHLVEGIVRCGAPSCLSEFPVLDGVPYVLAGLREVVGRDILAILARDDLSGEMESLVGDCCGPGSPFDTTRQQLSSYGWDHWADLDPDEDPATPGHAGDEPGSVVRLLAAGLERVGDLPAGPLLDLGCSVGRGTFELAARSGRTTVGVDLHTPMLRLAVRVLRRGRVRYPRREVGLVYRTREFDAAPAAAERVDFWACDAGALPFPEATFAGVMALNLLDSAHSPIDALASVFRVLRPGGKAILACPYDWSPAATPFEAWVGGHSQRGEYGGSAETVLRTLLTPGAHPASIDGARIVAEEESLPWRVRLHDRSAVDYRTHLVVAEKQ